MIPSQRFSGRNMYTLLLVLALCALCMLVLFA